MVIAVATSDDRACGKLASAGPHQPQRASAVVGVATAATAIVVAAVRAVRDFLMASPMSVERTTKLHVESCPRDERCGNPSAKAERSDPGGISRTVCPSACSSRDQ